MDRLFEIDGRRVEYLGSSVIKLHDNQERLDCMLNRELVEIRADYRFIDNGEKISYVLKTTRSTK